MVYMELSPPPSAQMLQCVSFYKHFFSSVDLPVNSVNYSLIDRFNQKLIALSQITFDLFRELESHHHQRQVFIDHNGIYYLIRSLAIVSHINQYSCRSSDSSSAVSISNNSIVLNVASTSEEIKKIELYLLLCLASLIDNNQEAICIVIQRQQYLSTISIFITSYQISCRILVLKILGQISKSAKGAAKVLETLTVLCFTFGETNRFQTLINMLATSNIHCSSGKIMFHILDLLACIMKNVNLAERIRVQCELKEAGFALESLQMNAKKENCKSSKTLGIIQELRSLYADVSRTLGCEFISNEAEQLRRQIMQLSRAFNRLETKKKNLLNVEKELKDKYETLMKNALDQKSPYTGTEWMDSWKSPSSLMETSGEPPIKTMPDNEYFAVDNINVKSSEEEIVCASVMRSNIELVNDRSNCVNHGEMVCNQPHSLFDNVEQQNKQPRGTNQTLLEDVFTGNNYSSTNYSPKSYTDTFKTNKYFSYIMASENNLDSVATRDKSIRKSLLKMLRFNNSNVGKHNASQESVCSWQNYEPGSRMAVSTSEQHHTNWKRQSLSSLNDSIRSSSLPNVFWSNFILRKNNDIYLCHSGSSLSSHKSTSNSE